MKNSLLKLQMSLESSVLYVPCIYVAICSWPIGCPQKD